MPNVPNALSTVVIQVTVLPLDYFKSPCTLEKKSFSLSIKATVRDLTRGPEGARNFLVTL